MDTEAMVHYLVDAPEGAVGVLDGWVHDRQGRPTHLVVAQGWLGRRRVEIPVEAITAIDHAGRRVLVAGGAAPVEDRKARLRLGRLRPRGGRAQGSTRPRLIA